MHQISLNWIPEEIQMTVARVEEFGSAGRAADLDGLYRALSKPLERIVRFDVHAPDPVIEDACQFAWTRFLHHHGQIHREKALAWLVKTAVHEALKLVRRGSREQSLDAEREDRGE